MPIQPGEPVYFLSLELQNVGAFGPEGVRIDLSDGHGRPAKWTLILGENGIGKTTALEGLLALTPLPVKGRLADGPSIIGRIWTLNGKYDSLRHQGNDKPLRLLADIVSQEGLNERSTAYQLRYEMTNESADSLVVKLKADSPCEGASEWPGQSIYGYRAGRDIDFDEARYPEPPVAEQSYRQNLSLRVFAPISVDEWLIALHHNKAAMVGDSAASHYEEVTHLLIEALPGVKDIRAAAPEGQRDFFLMEYLTDDGWVPYRNLGLGYKSVLGLIGDLAYRLYRAYPSAEKPLTEAAVVLIDEIDLHLHAKWQRDLIRVLSERFPNVQFIATAHSPLMVQAAAGHNLVLLYRDPETRQVRVANDVDDIANWRLDQIVTSELFGAPSARPPKYDDDVRRRDAILVQPDLSEEDRAEVRRIEGRLADVPLADSPKERRTEELLQRTLQLLEKKAEG